MKAMLLTDYKQLELTDMPVPEPQSDELLVRVHSCGVCGSDIHGFDGSSGRRVPPLIMGHEASGVVENTGSNAGRFQVGDRVTFDSMLPCGKRVIRISARSVAYWVSLAMNIANTGPLLNTWLSPNE